MQRVLFEAHDLRGVTVELTTAASSREIDELADRAAALRRSGALLSVSYGNGETSQRDIRALQPSVLKLREPFVFEIRRVRPDDVLGEALANLGRRLGADIVVQNVERMEDLLALRQLGIRFVQGYVVGVPTTNGNRSRARSACGRWKRTRARVDGNLPNSGGVASHRFCVARERDRGASAQPGRGDPWFRCLVYLRDVCGRRRG